MGKYNIEEKKKVSQEELKKQADVQAKEYLEDLKKKLEGRSLFIGYPVYDGKPFGDSFMAVGLVEKLGMKLGVHVHVQKLFYESLVQRARNYLVDIFYESDCTHMMFWDADVVIENPIEVFAMLAECGRKDENTKKTMDIVAASYAKKNVAWDKILLAAKAGLSDEKPELLQLFGMDSVVNFFEGKQKIDLRKPLEVKEAGTGATIFGKNVIEKLRKKNPDKKYFPDHKRTKNFDGSKPIYALFDCGIDENKRYLSEDYYFNKLARKAGFNTFLFPWIRTRHIGSYDYVSDMAALIKLNNAVGNEYQINFSGVVTKKEKKDEKEILE